MTADELKALIKRFTHWLSRHTEVQDTTMVRWCPLFKDFDESEPNLGDIRQAAFALAEYAELKAKLGSGWVMVPKEPTRQMRKAGSGRWMMSDREEMARETYLAMLAVIERERSGK
jgi:hypothetical protein